MIYADPYAVSTPDTRTRIKLWFLQQVHKIKIKLKVTPAITCKDMGCTKELWDVCMHRRCGRPGAGE